MSHNRDTRHQPTISPSQSMGLLNLDLEGFPSLTDEVYPFEVDLPFFGSTASPSFQPLSVSFPSLEAFEGLNSYFGESSEREMDPNTSWFPDTPTDPRHHWLNFDGDGINPLVNHRSSASPFIAPVSLSEGVRPILPSAVTSRPANHLDPRGKQKVDISIPPMVATSSSNPSLKRDFASAFECPGFSVQEPVERSMYPQTAWFPNFPMDGQANLHAKGSHGERIDNERQSRKDEEQNQVLRNQIKTLQASFEEERRLREAATGRVKELERKLRAVVRELERRRKYIDHLVGEKGTLAIRK